MKHTVFLFTFLFFALGLIFSAPKAYALSEADIKDNISLSADYINNYFDNVNINSDDYYYICGYNDRFNPEGFYICFIPSDLEYTLSIRYYGIENCTINFSSSSDKYCYPLVYNIGSSPAESSFIRFNRSFQFTLGVNKHNDICDIYKSPNLVIDNQSSEVINLIDLSTGIDYGSVESISNAGLLARMYDITFTPTISYPSNSSLLNQSLKAVPVAVRDDTGYNVISLQVPQLGAYADTIFYGQFHFKPHFTTSKYYFNTFKMSFGSDPLNENDDIYDDTISSDMFHLLIDINGTVSSPSSKIMTVNSLSFFYNTKIQKYSNREFVIFDYSSDDDNLYPDFRFEGIGSINMYSAGTIVYNCDFSGLFDVSENAPATPDKVKQLSDEGNSDSSDTVDKLGYIPRDVSYPDFNQGFDIGNPDIPDFSVLGNIFSFMFENRVIRVMLLNCLLVGLAGFVLYGKKGGG